MNTREQNEKLANQLLNAARLDNLDRPTGIASHDVAGYGKVIVTWDRIAKVYDVGTEARSWAKGRRSIVLSVLVALLGKGGVAS